MAALEKDYEVGRNGLSGGRGRRGRGILDPLQPSLRQRLPDAAHVRAQHATKIISNATFNQPTLKIFIFITQIFIFATEYRLPKKSSNHLCACYLHLSQNITEI